MGLVHPYRTAIGTADVLSGVQVRADTWRSVARNNNWLLGRGAQNVVGCCPGVTLTGGAGAYTFPFRFLPRYQALQRRWQFGLRTSSETLAASATITIGGVSTTHRVEPNRDTITNVIHVQALASQSSALADVTVTISATGGDVIVESIECWDIPRAELVDGATNDMGHSDVAFNPRQPILYAAGSVPKLQTPITAMASDAIGIVRRNLLSWSVPSALGGVTSTSFAAATTSATHEDLFTLAVPVLLPKRGRTAVTGGITVNVYAWCSNGTTTGEFTVSLSNSGGAYGDFVKAITATTPTWGETGSYSADCEDMGSTDGRQTAASPATDYLNIGIRRTAGAGTVYVAAAQVVANVT